MGTTREGGAPRECTPRGQDTLERSASVEQRKLSQERAHNRREPLPNADQTKSVD